MRGLFRWSTAFRRPVQVPPNPPLVGFSDTVTNVDGTSRFYFSFENHDCPDYITEKFFNVIRAGKMIPIVMGASKEAYNLFGPEVNIGLVVLDDGWMVLTKMC